MCLPTLSLVLCLAIFSLSTSALRAVSSGACASACGDFTSTSGSDIVCSDRDFASTAKGQAFEACITCQMNSTAVDITTGDTDLMWLLYNLRFAISACLFDYPNSTQVQNTPCITGRACGPFQSNIQYDSLLPNITTYEYCSNFPASNFETQCVACLQQLGTDFYIANFFTAIIAGCNQQTGSSISLDGSLFSTTPVNITTPSPHSSSATKTGRPGKISLGAGVGIAVSGFLLILGTAGFCTVWCGKRRRRRHLAARARLSASYTDFNQETFISPVSPTMTKWNERGRFTDESPVTAGGYENDQKHGFTPYSSHYSSPVSARDALKLAEANWELPQSSQGAMGMMRTKEEAGEIEMEKIEAMDRRRHEEWMKEAQGRGFTTPPIIKLPEPHRTGEVRY